jgi:hypothetical protein
MRTIAGRPEIERINFLIQRDGERTTRTWVERTLSIYREAITKPGSHASIDSYRPLFERSIHTFEAWLAGQTELGPEGAGNRKG